MSLTLVNRAAYYTIEYPDRPPMYASDRWLEGTWIGGNDYKGSGYYGAYPPDYLQRVWALFPDMRQRRYLHLFSGSLTATDGKFRVDINPKTNPSIAADALRLPFQDGVFDFIMADTPYSAEHAVHYGTGMPSRKKAVTEAGRVTRSGGFMVWLDTKLPMFSKTTWNWCGSIMVIRSTNHDFRGATIFQRI